MAIVISAYPACGKSTVYRQLTEFKDDLFGLKVLDSDSSKFSWIYDADGNKTNERNPEFPENYIKHIQKHLEDTDVIFVSSHEIVREALSKADIPFISIYPKDNIINMKEWKSRFLSRGNTQSFIQFQMEHWSEFIDALEKDSRPFKKIRLDAFTNPVITPELIFDLIDRYDSETGDFWNE